MCITKTWTRITASNVFVASEQFASYRTPRSVYRLSAFFSTSLCLGGDVEAERYAAFETRVPVVLVGATGAWIFRCLPKFRQSGMVYQLPMYDTAVLARRYTYSV